MTLAVGTLKERCSSPTDKEETFVPRCVQAGDGVGHWVQSRGMSDPTDSVTTTASRELAPSSHSRLLDRTSQRAQSVNDAALAG